MSVTFWAMHPELLDRLMPARGVRHQFQIGLCRNKSGDPFANHGMIIDSHDPNRILARHDCLRWRRSAQRFTAPMGRGEGSAV